MDSVTTKVKSLKFIHIQCSTSSPSINQISQKQTACTFRIQILNSSEMLVEKCLEEVNSYLCLKKGQVTDSPSIFPTSHVIDHCGIAKTRQWVMIGTINPPPCLAFGTLVFPNEMRKTSSSKRLQQLFHGLSLFWDIDDTIGENPLLFIGLCSTMRRKRYLELLTAIN